MTTAKKQHKELKFINDQLAPLFKKDEAGTPMLASSVITGTAEQMKRAMERRFNDYVDSIMAAYKGFLSIPWFINLHISIAPNSPITTFGFRVEISEVKVANCKYDVTAKQ